MTAPTGKRDRKRAAAIRRAVEDSFCFGKKDCVLLWDSAWPMAGPPGNPEATPECSAYSGPCNAYRQHRDLAGEFMVSAVEIGGDPFSYHYTNGVV